MVDRPRKKKKEMKEKKKKAGGGRGRVIRQGTVDDPRYDTDGIVGRRVAQAQARLSWLVDIGD